MLHYIKGRVADTFENGVVIENNGIGYELNVPSTSALYAALGGEAVTAYTAMIVREDNISLYGFDDRESLTVFRMLTTVSGIGAKAAIAILSALTSSEIKKAIVFNDPDTLAKAQGVGKKTAQRIVLELKDKVEASAFADGIENSEPSGGRDVLTGVTEAVSALVALGYSKSEASEAVASTGLENGADVEEYIKAALKKLSKF